MTGRQGLNSCEEFTPKLLPPTATTAPVRPDSARLGPSHHAGNNLSWNLLLLLSQSVPTVCAPRLALSSPAGKLFYSILPQETEAGLGVGCCKQRTWQ